MPSEVRVSERQMLQAVSSLICSSSSKSSDGSTYPRVISEVREIKRDHRNGAPEKEVNIEIY